MTGQIPSTTFKSSGFPVNAAAAATGAAAATLEVATFAFGAFFSMSHEPSLQDHSVEQDPEAQLHAHAPHPHAFPSQSFLFIRSEIRAVSAEMINPVHRAHLGLTDQSHLFATISAIHGARNATMIRRIYESDAELLR